MTNDAATPATLTGTAKQIAWAESIRAKYLSQADGLLMTSDAHAVRTGLRDSEEYATGRADLVARIGRLESKESAAWWIDTARFQTIHSLLRAI